MGRALDSVNFETVKYCPSKSAFFGPSAHVLCVLCFVLSSPCSDASTQGASAVLLCRQSWVPVSRAQMKSVFRGAQLCCWWECLPSSALAFVLVCKWNVCAVLVQTQASGVKLGSADAWRAITCPPCNRCIRCGLAAIPSRAVYAP